MSAALESGWSSPASTAAVRQGRAAFGAALRLLPLVLLLLLIGAPLLAVLSHLFADDQGLLRHLAQTVLLDYARNTALICIGVGLGTAVAGAVPAWLVTIYDFPGRRIFAWAMVLPLAMPAYVLAYAYTDFLQVTGPLQTALRQLTGWGVRDYWFPEIRSVGGAVFVLSAVLYPYVYVLARAAFLNQSQCALEVSRTLGCTPLMTFRRVGLPLARPAIAAGVAFAIMEAVADFGAVSFFGVPTFTTGIYRSWYALGDPTAAAQLASLLLVVVLAVLSAERLSRGHAQFANNTTHIRPRALEPLGPVARLLASLLCALPLLAGFVAPLLILLAMALDTDHWLGAARLTSVAGNSLLLGLMASLLTVGVALGAVLVTGGHPGRLARALLRLASLGYAVPGAVIGVGIVVTVGAADRALDGAAHTAFGAGPGLVLGGSVAALLYGYLARFFAVGYSPLEAGLAKIGRNLTDAARALGCWPAAAFRRVHLPLLRPSLLSAGLLVLVDVLKELPATLILRPFDFDTLAVEAYRLATTERLAEAALPSALIVLAGLLPVMLLCRMLARDEHRPHRPE